MARRNKYRSNQEEKFSLANLQKMVEDDNNDLDDVQFSTEGGSKVSIKNNRGKDSKPGALLNRGDLNLGSFPVPMMTPSVLSGSQTNSPFNVDSKPTLSENPPEPVTDFIGETMWQKRQREIKEAKARRAYKREDKLDDLMFQSEFDQENLDDQYKFDNSFVGRQMAKRKKAYEDRNKLTAGEIIPGMASSNPEANQMIPNRNLDLGSFPIPMMTPEAMGTAGQMMPNRTSSNMEANQMMPGQNIYDRQLAEEAMMNNQLNAASDTQDMMEQDYDMNEMSFVERQMAKRKKAYESRMRDEDNLDDLMFQSEFDQENMEDTYGINQDVIRMKQKYQDIYDRQLAEENLMGDQLNAASDTQDMMEQNFDMSQGAPDPRTVIPPQSYTVKMDSPEEQELIASGIPYSEEVNDDGTVTFTEPGQGESIRPYTGPLDEQGKMPKLEEGIIKPQFDRPIQQKAYEQQVAAGPKPEDIPRLGDNVAPANLPQELPPEVIFEQNMDDLMFQSEFDQENMEEGYDAEQQAEKDAIDEEVEYQARESEVEIKNAETDIIAATAGDPQKAAVATDAKSKIDEVMAAVEAKKLPPEAAEEEIKGFLGGLGDLFGVEGKDLMRALGRYALSRAVGFSNAGSAKFAYSGFEQDQANKMAVKEQKRKTEAGMAQDAKKSQENYDHYDKLITEAEAAGNTKKANFYKAKQNSITSGSGDLTANQRNLTAYNNEIAKIDQAVASGAISAEDANEKKKVVNQVYNVNKPKSMGRPVNLKAINDKGLEEVVAGRKNDENSYDVYIDGEWKRIEDTDLTDVQLTGRNADQAVERGYKDPRSNTSIPNSSWVSNSGEPAFPFKKEGDKKSYQLAKRAVDALPVIQDMVKDPEMVEKLTSLMGGIQSYASGHANSEIKAAFINKMVGEEMPQKFKSATSAWLQALLRADTGAAYSETEIMDYISTNIPQVGDTPETVEYKMNQMVATTGTMAANTGIGSPYLLGRMDGTYEAPDAVKKMYGDMEKPDQKVQQNVANLDPAITGGQTGGFTPSSNQQSLLDKYN